MSCLHGEWHEEDCEICTMQNAHYEEITKLKQQRDELAALVEVMGTLIQDNICYLGEAGREALSIQARTLEECAAELNSSPMPECKRWAADFRAMAAAKRKGE